MAEPRGPDGAATSTPEPTDASLFCTRAAGSRYAFDASLVAEVVRLGPITRLPAAPPFLLGIMAHRGEVLAVLDLARFLGETGVTLRPSTRAAVVEVGAWKLVVVADAVDGLRTVARAEFESPPAENPRVAPFLTAIARDATGAIAVLDLARLVEAARAQGIAA